MSIRAHHGLPALVGAFLLLVTLPETHMRADVPEETQGSLIARQLAEHWEIPAETASTDTLVKIRMDLAPDGRVADYEIVWVTGDADGASRRAVVDAARAAVEHFRNAPFLGLPLDDYEVWRSMMITFDPTQILSDP